VAPQTGSAETGYSRWICDVRLHRVNPLKLKVKADSLLNEYDTADIGLNPEHVLVAAVYQGGGAFRAMQEPKKKPATRQAMLEHLAAKGELTSLPVPKHFEIPLALLGQIKIVQPEVFGEDSLFVGIPVFGAGRIAIRTPGGDTATERAYISFTLSQFREYSQIVGDAAQVPRYGSVASIPLEDETTQLTCHYSDNKLQSLEHIEFYTADPAYKIAPIGRKCQSCGLIVSEDSRKKEKISSKCPKCKGKFGNIVLQGIKSGPGIAVPAP
jgi:predicted Zn-ribbon and HTH transcriptional regulator